MVSSFIRQALQYSRKAMKINFQNWIKYIKTNIKRKKKHEKRKQPQEKSSTSGKKIKLTKSNTNIVRCCIYLTTYDWIKSFLKITIERRAIYGNLENKINTLYLARTGENSIHKNNAQWRNDADGKLQVSGRCLILCIDHYVFSLRTSKKVRQT